MQSRSAASASMAVWGRCGTAGIQYRSSKRFAKGYIDRARQSVLGFSILKKRSVGGRMCCLGSFGLSPPMNKCILLVPVGADLSVF
jgi:hypothetical protein